MLGLFQVSECHAIQPVSSYLWALQDQLLYKITENVKYMLATVTDLKNKPHCIADTWSRHTVDTVCYKSEAVF